MHDFVVVAVLVGGVAILDAAAFRPPRSRRQSTCRTPLSTVLDMTSKAKNEPHFYLVFLAVRRGFYQSRRGFSRLGFLGGSGQ